MIALKTEKLQVGYGKKVVVDGVEISGLRGQVVCLLGPNGAGKTTILRTLSGLLEPMGGVVYVNNRKLANKKKKDLAKELSVVLTQKASCGLMTVFEVAAMGRYPYTNHFGRLSEKDVNMTYEALKTVNAEYLAERYFEELSDGEKQKVLVARALVQEPEIMVLDEPTTHLDIRHRLELVDILKKLSKEKNITVILSLHEVDIALKSCDKVVLIKDNRIIGYGVPEEVVNENIIKELYSIKDANFNNLLGSIEISNSAEPSVFVIGGSGYGIPVYRLLAKYGIGVTTGVIHENDVDYEIARTMGVVIQSEAAFEEINDESIVNAKKMIDKVDTVIDSGCPIGKVNRKNMELLTYALDSGKKVLSIRNKEECDKLLGVNHTNTRFCQSTSEIIDNLKAGGKHSV